MINAYIALGSNLGDSRALLSSALAAVAKLPGTDLESVSPAYVSKAVGPGEQRDYLNLVARLSTALPAHELLQALQRIESDHGRRRSERWAARTLDLDILLYGDQTLSDASLTVPHPRMAERDFVLVPLSDLDPDLTLPCGTPISTLLARCPDAGLQALGDTIAPGRTASGKSV